MKWIRFALAMVVVGLAFTAASAQSGGLTVTVADEVGPLPGAIVTISHETGFIKTTAVQTDVRGEAVFPVLRPGRGYVIEVSMQSFATQRYDGIHVRINDNQTIPVVLSQAIVETVKVIADGQVVKLEDTQKTTRFSEEFIQDLPVPGRFYQNVLTLAPGVNDADGDGNPNVHGSRDRDFKTSVGGVSNVDPLTGQQMSQINPNSIEEMEVITAGAGAEFSRAQGGFANIIQKQGSNEFEGVFEFYYRSHVFDGTGARDVAPSIPDVDFVDIQPSFQFSGPLVKDKLWYRLSHEFIDQEDPVPTSRGIFVQKTEQAIHSDQLTWQVSPRNKLSLQYQSDPQTIDGFGVTSLRPYESSLYFDRTSETSTLSWTAPLSPKILVESLVSWQDLNTIRQPVQANTANLCVPFEDNAALSTAQCFDIDSAEISGTYFQYNEDNRQRLTVSGKATVYGGRFWGMGHQFKVGLIAENERYFRRLDRAANLTQFKVPLDPDAQGDQNLNATLIFGNVSVPQRSDVRATGTNWGVYAEDQIRIRQNLSMTLGLRYDREEISSNGNVPLDPEGELSQLMSEIIQRRGASDYNPGLLIEQNFTAFEDVTDFVDQLRNQLGLDPNADINLSQVARNSFRWIKSRGRENIDLTNNNFAPRLSLSWDPWSNNKTRFALTAGRYYDKLFLNIPLIELEPSNANIVLRTPPPGQTGGLRPSSSVNPTVNISAVARDLRTPYQDEWTFGFEREIFAETSLSIDYINRRFRDQLQDIDLNHVPGDYGFCNPDVRPGNTDPVIEILNRTDPDFVPLNGDVRYTYGDGIIDDCGGDLVPQPPSVTEDPVNSLIQRGLRLERPDGIPDLYVQNPGWGDIFLVGNFNKIDYEGVVIALNRRQYRSWQMQTSYTWSKATGDGEDFAQSLGDDRSLLTDESGYQSYDQRHVVKFNATTITPWGFRLGGAISWQSGLPYSLLSQEASFDQPVPTIAGSTGNSTRVRRNYITGSRNDQRNQSYWNVDAKFTKEMNLGRGLNMQFSVEVFNLLNDGSLQIYNPVSQTGQQINGRNNGFYRFGRRWQMGFKLAF